MAQQIKHLYKFGPFLANSVEGILLRDNERIPLSPMVFKLLLIFVQHPDQVLDNRWLKEQLWGDANIGEPEDEGSANLQVNISTLRKALDDDSHHPKYIETISKRGYRFIATVAARPHEGHSATSQQVLKYTALGLVLAIIVFTIYRCSIPKEPQIRLVAVLPFTLLNDNEKDRPLQMGIPARLISDLGNIRQIRVLPIERVSRHLNQNQDPLIVGRELFADLILTGKIQSTPNAVRVYMELIQVKDGKQIWKGHFDAVSTDVLKIEDSISEQTIVELKHQLVMTRYTENAEAFNLYKKGRDAWKQRTVESTEEGIRYFEQAINKDPLFALAHSGLADSYLVYGPIVLGKLSAKDAAEKQRAAAQKAIELDGELAEAHTSVAITKMFYYWERAEAGHEFKRSLEIFPGYALGHHWYGAYLTTMGRHGEAIEKGKRAQELDPTSFIISNTLAGHYYFAKQYEQAVDQYRKAMQMAPQHYIPHHDIALVYAQQGNYREAIPELNTAIALSSRNVAMITTLGYIRAVSEDKSTALILLDELQGLAQSTYVSPLNFALIYTALGEKDQALNWLEKAYSERLPGLVYLKVEPRFEKLREDSRFGDILRRIGFVP